ncbi:peptidoglycan DD-metalloendopeptidase family protein [Paenibacillus sp. HJL G12]|uniref:Peptidoglycan DD-metalloendopeptidase family protein n=1 Tax=Paenibacillus dendrobii TaxID=2691084 RepID=A0A7X3LJX1_9BACL|nr:M23 family metallopeptidase [Paenibacillus dendrobii]MWV46715.1 peptidoglycan DD-metalloendopeptidase family protein [Paenibacillus dendrobii]
MDTKSSIKQRREERIKDLLLREDLAQPILQPVQETPKLWNKGKLPESYAPEPDPEKLWKKEQAKGRGPFHHKTRFFSGMMWRLFFSAIIFVLVWGIFKFPQPWSMKVQDYVMQSLNREMDFQAAEVWYESHFGKAPTFIPIFKQNQTSPIKVNASKSLYPPIDGEIVQAFAVSLKGVEIAPRKVSNIPLEVKSVETGRVIDVTGSADTGITVTIQHTGKIVASYGHLADTRLQKNDWVEGGDAVGHLQAAAEGETPSLFFSVKENGNYVDPADVIPID